MLTQHLTEDVVPPSEKAPGRDILTTQLYFPGEPGNRGDPLYRRELELRFVDDGIGRFDFVLNRG